MNIIELKNNTSYIFSAENNKNCTIEVGIIGGHLIINATDGKTEIGNTFELESVKNYLKHKIAKKRKIQNDTLKLVIYPFTYNEGGHDCLTYEGSFISGNLFIIGFAEYLGRERNFGEMLHVLKHNTLMEGYTKKIAA